MDFFYRLLRTVVSSLKIPSRCHGFIFVDLYIHQLQTLKTVLIVINVVRGGVLCLSLGQSCDRISTIDIFAGEVGKFYVGKELFESYIKETNMFS